MRITQIKKIKISLITPNYKAKIFQIFKSLQTVTRAQTNSMQQYNFKMHFFLD